MSQFLENLVTQIWVVLYRQNLTACDTFNEETFSGPTQETKESFGFLTEADALKFYEQRKASLKFAGCAGDYYTYPVNRELPFNPKRNVKLECVTEGGCYYTIAAPAIKVICPSCDGEGTELCGGLKGAAFSPEEMNEDPDFRESYFGGDFDVQCSECKGEKIILEPAEIEISLPTNIVDDYFRLEKQKREDDAADAAERRYFERARGE